MTAQAEQLAADLTADPRIVTAAHIAYSFKLDPVEVLASDRRLWLIRAAAAQVIAAAKTPTDNA